MPALEPATDVLQQFSQGNVDAFEALFRQHQGDVYRWILRIVRDPAIAEDVTV
jgi:DNA-directed RNA polymerase specialized sigma24 family protein